MSHTRARARSGTMVSSAAGGPDGSGRGLRQRLARFLDTLGGTPPAG
jgi:hypothetical protein